MGRWAWSFPIGARVCVWVGDTDGCDGRPIWSVGAGAGVVVQAKQAENTRAIPGGSPGSEIPGMTFTHIFNRRVRCTPHHNGRAPAQGEAHVLSCEWTEFPKPKHVREYVLLGSTVVAGPFPTAAEAVKVRDKLVADPKAVPVG